MKNFTLYFHKFTFAVLFIGFVFIITTESSLPIQLADFLTNNSIIEKTLAQPSFTNTSTITISNNSEEQNKSTIIKAFGHFANNQIKDGIVTWIQGGFWELAINNIMTNDNSNLRNNKNPLINNNSSEADFYC